MPRNNVKRFFDSFFRVNKLDFFSGAGYLTLGLVAGYIYRNIPIRVECNMWTNFILDPYKISYAHIALIIVILHSFNGFGKYVFLPTIGTYGNRFYHRDFHGIGDTMYFLNIVYPIPLFLLTLYYNYGYDYGITGLHLVYPLIAIIPFLLNGHKSRDLCDMSQIITGISVIALGAMNKNYYAIASFGVQGFAYYFNSIRGMQYKHFSSQHWHNIAMVLSCWLMYLALLQSCLDNNGSINCVKAKEIFEKINYCENKGLFSLTTH